MGFKNEVRKFLLRTLIPFPIKDSGKTMDRKGRIVMSAAAVTPSARVIVIGSKDCRARNSYIAAVSQAVTVCDQECGCCLLH